VKRAKVCDVSRSNEELNRATASSLHTSLSVLAGDSPRLQYSLVLQRETARSGQPPEGSVC